MKRLALHSICPYFAMFPESFVREAVETFTSPGEWVLDPFSGRGTTVLESRLAGREAAALDINPVAFCLSRAKAEIPALKDVQRRLDQLNGEYLEGEGAGDVRAQAEKLPGFFRRAYHYLTLRELLFLRPRLQWKTNRTDGFIAAVILGSLHGEMDRSSAYFSNQLPRTIAVKPDYALRWWDQKNLFPRRRKVFAMLREKVRVRLTDIPEMPDGYVRLCDVRSAHQELAEFSGRFSLLITSPPYLDVTRFEEDQWLRLWFLGGVPFPTYSTVSKDDRHSSVLYYTQFLTDAWTSVRHLLRPDAIAVIRIGAKKLSQLELADCVRRSFQNVFSEWHEVGTPLVTSIKRRQARAFNPSAAGCGTETDFIFEVSA